MHIQRAAESILLIAAIAACDDTPPVAVRAPIIGEATVALNELNALSAHVEFAATGADSARIVFRPASGGAADSTPLVAIHAARSRLAALGLFADTTYVAVVKATRRGLYTVSDTLRFRTNPLPARLQNMSMSVQGIPPLGFILLSPIGLSADSTGYAVAYDGTGRIRWYRAFPGGPVTVEVKQQRNGNFTAGMGPIPLVG